MTWRERSFDLPFAPEAARHARSLVRQCAAELSADVADDAELVVSELVTNAVVHGMPSIRLTVVVEDDRLTVRVADGSSRLPARAATPTTDALSGRGLEIVELLSAAWGTEPDRVRGGKTVWSCVKDSARTDADRVIGVGQIEGGTAWN
ncbi:ATP-binding protein [Nocardioides sp. CER19]|uniref:ATP-binding protein n=1 Tax=Nocardioides sp. CER19 TaxID=3038538 RepID=UPI00244768DF|nr:ATP-binding protein [Nocardioides sp. CER19]MDH2414919.1 ATP-binding protein [Nocardioides sp. CER19]